MAAAEEQLRRLAAYDPFAAGAAERPAGERCGATRSRAYLLLDVFSDTPLAGNPLAVVPDARGLSAHTMQRIARELNLSETVFVLGADGGPGSVRVRIFTPSAELPFAGHPVLGCAIAAGAALERAQVTLETAAGPVPVELEPLRGPLGHGRMRQPLPSWSPFERERELLRALGVQRARLPVELYANGPRHVLVALDDEDAVAQLALDARGLRELGELCVSCFALAAGAGDGAGAGGRAAAGARVDARAAAGAGVRVTTRVFAPALGVAEDPATGSAAGPLAVHLARHGEIAFGEEIEITQGLQVGRPSRLYARARGSAERLEQVEVAGAAVFVGRGSLVVGD